MDDSGPSIGGIRVAARFLLPTVFTLLLMAVGTSDSVGATAVSRIFGAVPVTAQGETDTPLAIPMKIPAVFRATVGSVAGDLTLAGPLEADLWVSTSGTDSDWIVKLIDVFPGDLDAGHELRVRQGADDQLGDLPGLAPGRPRPGAGSRPARPRRVRLRWLSLVLA